MGQFRVVIDARESGTSTGRYVDKLIEYLGRLQPPYKIVILTRAKRIDYLQKLAPRFQVLPTRYKEFTFGEQLGLLKQLHKLAPDLVHFPMAQQPILYQGKVVTTIQDLTTARFRNPTKNWLVFTIKQQVYKWVNRIVAHKSALLITPSEFVKQDIARFARVNSRKITVTYEAADPISDQPEPVEVVQGRQYIMYVGRPQPHKNLERLIQAFALLRPEHPGLRLVLVGKKDSMYKRLEKFAQAEGVTNVVFTDFVSEGQLRWLYENTAAYVFPSLSEGFGLPPLEAMVHGAPVVSSNATCLPEINKDAAEYFDPLDVEAMAAAINKVLTDEKLRKGLISRGKAVVNSYSWKRMAEQTLEVYKQVLGDN